MSQENVEIVRAAFDAWNRGDIEAWISAWDEQAEFYPLRAQRCTMRDSRRTCAFSV